VKNTEFFNAVMLALVSLSGVFRGNATIENFLEKASEKNRLTETDVKNLIRYVMPWDGNKSVDAADFLKALLQYSNVSNITTSFSSQCSGCDDGKTFENAGTMTLKLWPVSNMFSMTQTNIESAENLCIGVNNCKIVVSLFTVEDASQLFVVHVISRFDKSGKKQTYPIEIPEMLEINKKQYVLQAYITHYGDNINEDKYAFYKHKKMKCIGNKCSRINTAEDVNMGYLYFFVEIPDSY